MTIILEIYILICVMLLLFDIFFLITKNIRRLNFYKATSKFDDYIQDQFKMYKTKGSFDSSIKSILPSKLKKTKNLILLQNELEVQPSMRAIMKPFIFDKAPIYHQKSVYEQAFYTYLISTLDYKDTPLDKTFTEHFISFLDSKSLYTFSNTMEAFYKFGDVHLMLLAITKIDERIGFYHKKLFVDGLLTFQGDFQFLADLLVEKFHTYKDETKESLLDFFRLKGLNVSDLCLNLLKNNTTADEVKYAAMRYFIKFPHDEAKTLFIDYLSSEDTFWIVQTLSIQGLRSYNDDFTKSLIMSKISHSNWYVRLNASKYLYHQQIKACELFSILAQQDQYANEILLYQYRNDQIFSNYILYTMKYLESKNSSTKSIKPDRRVANV